MILLTFDVEEFDTPLEYGFPIPFEQQIERSTAGLEAILKVLDAHDVRCTFFTTATFAKAQPELMKRIAAKHEIGSHTYYHSSFENKDLLDSRLCLEEISGKKVTGFRMPRLAPVSNAELLKAGYIYNSSLNPTWIPGRYNHLGKPRVAFFEEGLLQIPASVTPFFRIPLFWLSFKVFPVWLLKSWMRQTLKHDKVLSLYFHPWEFADIRGFGLPSYMSRLSGEGMLQRLDETIKEMKQHGRFATMKEYAEGKGKGKSIRKGGYNLAAS